MVTAYQVAAEVPDPELPVLTIDELGILRGVRERRHGGHRGLADDVQVEITPTYSGCPALDAIRSGIENALRDNGFGHVSVVTRLSPPWSTDWISPAGKEKLRAYGIAPPGPAGPAVAAGPAGSSGGTRTVQVALTVRCPRCGSPETEQLSRFGSTACKAIWRCRACAEPFEAVKPL